MAVFKCKMCGGSLEVTEGMTVCECEYCGTKQTLPRTDNEQTLNMFNRANHFRQQCEFDKAAEIYERMTAQRDDAELYWSIVLCRYGIEYVDDPLTKKKIPTCHRTQYKSILEDADYLEALSHADTVQKEVYKQEAEYIDKVQKGILEISNKEKPFDVFICYKETDDAGRRTPDSVLAQELYYGLEKEGFKVFFSRITLESKLGTEYEPYIFAALNSAKVMVVVGTKPEYFNAVWVRNEWSRYLMLIQQDRSRTLIPAYKDMDPYDLPDALSMFQAQDMSKLGFMQDLIRGIGKIAKDTPVQANSVQTTQSKPTNSNIENLLKRGALALEDGDWTSANNFYEQVLNQNVEEARAYVGKLQAEYKAHNFDELINGFYNYTASNNYKKALRFAENGNKEQIDRAVRANDERISGLEDRISTIIGKRELLHKEQEEINTKIKEHKIPDYSNESKLSQLQEQLANDEKDMAEKSERSKMISRLEYERDNLGFLQGKRKKEIEAQLDKLKAKINNSGSSMDTIQQLKGEIEKLKAERSYYYKNETESFETPLRIRLKDILDELKQLETDEVEPRIGLEYLQYEKVCTMQEYADKTVEPQKTDISLQMSESMHINTNSRTSGALFYDVFLVSYNYSKMGVIKVVEDNLKIGYTDAKNMVENAPCFIVKRVSNTKAFRIKSEIEVAGGKAIVKPHQ